jgi:hypothetical protein
MPTLDIHKVDKGYSIARHILTALDEASPDGLTAGELGSLLRTNGSRAGAWLRDLRCRDWVAKVPVSPGSYIVRWCITDAGRAYLNAPE